MRGNTNDIPMRDVLGWCEHAVLIVTRMSLLFNANKEDRQKDSLWFFAPSLFYLQLLQCCLYFFLLHYYYYSYYLLVRILILPLVTKDRQVHVIFAHYSFQELKWSYLLNVRIASIQDWNIETSVWYCIHDSFHHFWLWFKPSSCNRLW